MDLDLIYMNSAKEDVGIMKDFTLDLAYGDSENNFECKIVDKQHCCKEGWFLYIENTEYGGIIDDIAVNSAKGVVTYLGRTWHGILNSKIIQPDNDADYLVLSGEANSVIATLINRMGVNSLFKAVDDDSGITITDYRMHRYISGYDGIVKMLKSVNAKLNMKFDGSYIELSVKPIIDYSNDEQFDTDQIALIIKKKYKQLNHVICLGKGELSNREVIHIYADENGNIVENQVFTGIDEVATVYENVNATGDELRKGGIDKIKAAWSSDELDFKFNNNEENYDIGDIVGGSEHITGTEVTKEITKKIVSIKNNTVTVSYPSESSGGKGNSSGGSSGETGGTIDAKTLVGKNAGYYKTAHNLLDNSDFRNPVNQRGQSSYSGDWIYTIDRWQASDNLPTLSVVSNGVKLTAQGLGYIYQRLEKVKAGKYTFAVKFRGNTGVIQLSNIKTDQGVIAAAESAETTGLILLNFEFADSDTSDSMNYQRIAVFNGEAIFEWTALYEGEYTAETLPEYMPKGYAHELLECQRYYYKFNQTVSGLVTSGATLLRFGIVTPIAMRDTPNLANMKAQGIRTVGGSNTSPTVTAVEVIHRFGNNVAVGFTFDTSTLPVTNNTPISGYVSGEFSADL